MLAVTFYVIFRMFKSGKKGPRPEREKPSGEDLADW
jgi:hypothetical protein